MNESGARMTDWAFISTSSLLIILSVEVRNPKESGNNRWESVQDGFQQQQHTKIVHVRLYVAVLLEVFQKKSCLFKCPDLPPSSCYSQACQSFSPLKQDAWVVLLSSALTQENPCTSKAIWMLQARKEKLCCQKHWPLRTVRYRFFSYVSKYDAVHCRNMFALTNVRLDSLVWRVSA